MNSWIVFFKIKIDIGPKKHRALQKLQVDHLCGSPGLGGEDPGAVRSLAQCWKVIPKYPEMMVVVVSNG